jgi:glycosyltransferase involved in cell wall biosynthesis
MKGWLKQYDMNIFLSENYRDINFAKQNKNKNIKIIHNGAAKNEFLNKSNIDIRKLLKIPKNHFLILTVGSHTGMKGHQEAIKIFKEINVSKSTLLIVGQGSFSYAGCFWKCKLDEYISRYLPEFKQSQKIILNANLTRPQVIAAYQAANLFLFPSRIECSPLVLFESAAAKLPFFTSDVGNAKEIVKWTKGGVVLPTTNDKLGFSRTKIKPSARIIEKYYLNPSKLISMGKMDHHSWLKSFTWEKIAKQYESLYESLIHP